MTRISRLPAVLGGLGAVVVLGVGASLAVGGTDNPTNNVRAALDGSKPKNVIFLLGDGMGTQEITAARYYAVGAAGKLNVDRMPFTGFDKTWSVKPAAAAPYLPDYDPDSASTGTEWATGRKTLDERISQGPSSAISVPGENYKTVLEEWQAAGKKVGDVSTAEITDATPAVLASHISLRGCQGPANMGSCASERKGAGGLGSIAEQEVDHKVDVLLGGGRDRFTATIPDGPDATKSVVQSAQDKGYQYVTDATGLDAVTDKGKPVLGLFNAGNMTTEFSQSAPSALGAGTTTTCNESARPASEPSLPAMTSKALSLLENDKGFFLQVEGASIDKQDHATSACGQIGETIAFDKAIGVALDYQQLHPDTLVVVTADHAHTSQIVSEDATGTGLPTGYSTNLVTKDGQTLSLTYGTAGYNSASPGSAPVATPPSQQHTGSVVPIWGIGPQGSAVLGTNDHTDLFDLLRGAKVAQAAPSTTTTVTQTQTVTGPTTTVSVPAKPGKPRVGLAVGSGATRKSGVSVSVAAVDAKGVKVTLKQGTKTISSKSLQSHGGIAHLPATKAKKGAVKVSVTATGTGGTATASATTTLKK